MSDYLQNTLRAGALLLGRLLIGGMFLYEGASKIAIYGAAGAYMQKFGVPSALLPLVIAMEIATGLCLIVGWQTHWAAFLLAGFTAMAALIFHHNFSNFNEMQFFEKDLAIAGGLLALFAAGGGEWSLDQYWRQ